jgi:dihydrodiol dehydrogenase / D-xylose 1-dehydrogenase (NADP)
VKGASFISTVFPSSAPDSVKPKIYTSYNDVYIDPEVDIVYIGTPHSYHKEQCLAAIAAGKHVLCEKPFTINAAEAEEVIAAAKIKGVYIMEGTSNFPTLSPFNVSDAKKEKLYGRASSPWSWI